MLAREAQAELSQLAQGEINRRRVQAETAAAGRTAFEQAQAKRAEAQAMTLAKETGAINPDAINAIKSAFPDQAPAKLAALEQRRSTYITQRKFGLTPLAEDDAARAAAGIVPPIPDGDNDADPASGSGIPLDDAEQNGSGTEGASGETAADESTGGDKEGAPVPSDFSLDAPFGGLDSADDDFYLPYDYRVSENPDGSISIVDGEDVEEPKARHLDLAARKAARHGKKGTVSQEQVDRLGFLLEEVNANGGEVPPDLAEEIGLILLSILPGSGNLISAKEAVEAFRLAAQALRNGNIARALLQGVQGLISTAGAAPGSGTAVRLGKAAFKIARLLYRVGRKALGRGRKVTSNTGKITESQVTQGKTPDSISKNLIYRSVDEGESITNYIGRTNNFERRAAEHLRSKGISIEDIPGLSNLSLSDAKAVEQVLIEYHGLGKNGGTLINKINSIAKSNPTYAEALKRGAEVLKSVGYL